MGEKSFLNNSDGNPVGYKVWPTRFSYFGVGSHQLV